MRYQALIDIIEFCRHCWVKKFRVVLTNGTSVNQRLFISSLGKPCYFKKNSTKSGYALNCSEVKYVIPLDKPRSDCLTDNRIFDMVFNVLPSADESLDDSLSKDLVSLWLLPTDVLLKFLQNYCHMMFDGTPSSKLKAAQSLIVLDVKTSWRLFVRLFENDAEEINYGKNLTFEKVLLQIRSGHKCSWTVKDTSFECFRKTSDEGNYIVITKSDNGGAVKKYRMLTPKYCIPWS